MKLVGYVRVSSQTQEDNTSLGEQKERIEAYCKAYGHDLVQVIEEVGSGKTMDQRPYFLEALDLVKTQADGIIATKLDRIARNTRDVLTLVEDVLKPLGKCLILLDLNVDTSSPTGLMILTIMSAVAQLERDVILERTKSGRQAKHEKGGYAYGAPRFGFKAVAGELAPNEQEQAVIDLIKRHRKSGKSYNAIATWLNDAGYKTKRGYLWRAEQVKQVLLKSRAKTKRNK